MTNPSRLDSVRQRLANHVLPPNYVGSLEGIEKYLGSDAIRRIGLKTGKGFRVGD